jgi:hypothetical protein
LPVGGLPPLESVLVLDAVFGSSVAGANVELVVVQAARSRVRMSSMVRMDFLIFYSSFYGLDRCGIFVARAPVQGDMLLSGSQYHINIRSQTYLEVV